MPVPATTGQLRTSIHDMKIGDYIACHYQASSGAIGTFSNLGGPAETEINIAGEAAPNGTFYCIKIAKGLLCSDRVVQHSISWDKLNSSKVIQGLPWDNGNIIPTMTSNTSPSGVASSSTQHSDNYAAWKAFDRKNLDYSNAWSSLSGNTSGWLAYEFPSPKIVTRYTITSPNSVNTLLALRAPKDWTFEGWDGTNWVMLDQQSGISWSLNEKKSFNINNRTPYLKYRINITANNGDASFVAIGEMEMLDTAGIIRSLTGGVAFADANGNSSTTDQGFGGWPTNNEWDKYIVNFPQELIQEGKTLDDVFHWKISTWCQDTPTRDLTSNSARVARGHAILTTSPKYFSWNSSDATSTTYGFRPVFEYKE